MKEVLNEQEAKFSSLDRRMGPKYHQDFIAGVLSQMLGKLGDKGTELFNKIEEVDPDIPELSKLLVCLTTKLPGGVKTKFINLCFRYKYKVVEVHLKRLIISEVNARRVVKTIDELDFVAIASDEVTPVGKKSAEHSVSIARPIISEKHPCDN